MPKTNGVELMSFTGQQLQSVTSDLRVGTTMTTEAGPPPSTDISSLIFQCAVVVIGVVGMNANGFVIFVTAHQLRKKPVGNLLILNQLILDFVSSFMLAVIYSVKLCSVDLEGTKGWWLCIFIFGDEFVWISIDSSMFNLAAITIERYLKVCHPLWHKANFRSWMVYAGIGFIWISTVFICFTTVPTTTKVLDGICFASFFFPNQQVQMAYGIWYFMSFYVILVSIFAFCYGRIFAAIRTQQKTFPGAAATGATGGETPQQKQVQLRMLKTMFLLTLSFAICWLPNQIHYLLLNMHPAGLNENTATYYGTIFFGFVNVCINPFIYGAKSELVNSYLCNLLTRCRCRKNSTDRSNQDQQQSTVSATAKSGSSSMQKF